MAVFIRAKRISDPFDDRVKARLLSNDDRHSQITTGYASSGSEHDATADDSSLSALVYGFYEINEPADINQDADEDNINVDDQVHKLIKTVQDLLDPSNYVRIHSDITNAAQALSGMKPSCPAVYRRVVMARLRARGYNAGICKSKWEKSGGGQTAGSYEYIDVIVDRIKNQEIDTSWI